MLQTLSSIATLALGVAMVFGAPVPDGSWPESKGSVSYEEVYTIKAGEVFDGKMKTYDRTNITCHGQEESGNSTAVFLLEPGATLKNAIIGTNQMEGVHCDESDCTIENVWWEDVCEDALSIKGGNASSVSIVIGGGARYADDKVIQHNGYGTVVVDGFFGQDFVDLEVIKTQRVNPNVSIVMMNGNFGDQAVLHNIHVKPSTENYTECASSMGTNISGSRPVILSNGPKNPVCQYSYDDVIIVLDNEQTQAQKQH
ncbi:hypothetical protein BBO99_00008264 [Phytophthora kernoviae]|uniref:Probable pectate lyase F n=2 Tax=Phytophthora kernoviae TaxID=325452 RepID=A0A3R7KQJ4_9STRA|nr:hypothetical protein G195_009619 [Phytophthora kernoviae 00238/432]KAG2515384.1 hypothetical protein JM18_008050 [Phytophthora kernoviae]RLN37129.1 hypothetical protein BBI17_008239 [Phytophthora kernoviae]RLN75530.1 hypothetical protein BBO99_00008264 [Phytophthora kernoviae]